MEHKGIAIITLMAIITLLSISNGVFADDSMTRCDSYSEQLDMLETVHRISIRDAHDTVKAKDRTPFKYNRYSIMNEILKTTKSSYELIANMRGTMYRIGCPDIRFMGQ